MSFEFYFNFGLLRVRLSSFFQNSKFLIHHGRGRGAAPLIDFYIGQSKLVGFLTALRFDGVLCLAKANSVEFHR